MPALSKTLTIKTYKAAIGARFNDAEAQEIGRRLENFGDVTPTKFVEDAKSPKSPLHKHLEWDDSVAAHAHRLQTARQIINHIEIVIVRSEGEQQTKAFHSVQIVRSPDVVERQYVSAEAVRGDEALRLQVLRTLRSELRGMRERLRGYEDYFGEVIEAIDQADKKVA